MKFVTYTATAGLDRLPEQDRFRVWCSTHKRLMQQDTDYRRRVMRYRLAILSTTAIFCIVTGLPASLLGVASWPQALSAAAFIVLTLAFVAFILYASFSTQAFQNERIGRELNDHAA